MPPTLPELYASLYMRNLPPKRVELKVVVLYNSVCVFISFMCSNTFFFENMPIRRAVMEKKMATHSSILAWRIPWTEEPGGLQSTGSQRVGHDWATSLSLRISTFNIPNLLFVFLSFCLLVEKNLNSQKIHVFTSSEIAYFRPPDL